MKVTISECEGNNDEAPTPETVREIVFAVTETESMVIVVVESRREVVVLMRVTEIAPPTLEAMAVRLSGSIYSPNSIEMEKDSAETTDKDTVMGYPSPSPSVHALTFESLT
jgi:hypothetical protein